MRVVHFYSKKSHRHSILNKKTSFSCVILVGVIDIVKPIQVYFIDVKLVLRRPISSSPSGSYLINWKARVQTVTFLSVDKPGPIIVACDYAIRFNKLYTFLEKARNH